MRKKAKYNMYMKLYKKIYLHIDQNVNRNKILKILNKTKQKKNQINYPNVYFFL